MKTLLIIATAEALLCSATASPTTACLFLGIGLLTGSILRDIRRSLPIREGRQ